jgi:hypothetical protein
MPLVGVRLGHDGSKEFHETYDLTGGISLSVLSFINFDLYTLCHTVRIMNLSYCNWRCLIEV